MAFDLRHDAGRPTTRRHGGGYDEPPPRMGFFTDTSVCIGCKACEVACKEWNHDPRGRAGVHRDVLRQHRRAGRRHLAPRRVHRAAQTAGRAAERGRGRRPRDARLERPGDGEAEGAERTAFRWLMSSDVCKHCTHAACLDVCPTGCAVPHRVRHRRGPGGHLQRLRLLRAGLPLRGDRPAQGRRPGVEVHPVLRPARRRSGAGLRQGLPDRLDPVRRAGRAAGARASNASSSCTTPASPTPASTATTPTTAWAAPAPSSCCWTSRRCTACRPTRW